MKSNAILLASGGATVGVGMGQVNRVDSARLAVGARRRPGGRIGGRFGRVLPVPGRACRCWPTAGVRAVVQPGGSMRDAEVVAAAEAAGLTMYLTGARHLYH